MFNFGEELRHLVTYDLYNCIGCNRCMDACPVTKEPLSIAELNEATMSPDPPKGKIYDFTVNCVQCARCVPVCPPGVRRDLMMLYLKWKLDEAGKFPGTYKRYVFFKQPDLSRIKRGLLRAKVRGQKDSLGPLYDKVDNFDDLREADLLFYPGCYIFNEVCHKTVALMEFLGEDYEILGGYQSCCGWPQYLQGRMQMASQLLDTLWQLIQKVNPKRIITTCAECYAALRKIKAVHKAAFEPMSTTEWLLRNIDKFPVVQTDHAYTLHESCHLSRKYRQYDYPRAILDKFGQRVEMDDVKDDTACCYYYNFEQDPNNEQYRLQRLQDAREKAGTMVVDCITCWEVYREKVEFEDLEIIDIQELFYRCIKEEGAEPEDVTGKPRGTKDALLPDEEEIARGEE